MYFCFMKRENIEKPVVVIYEKVDECPIKDRLFSFFQLVYVISGEGFYTINGNKKEYEAQNLFLLTPNDPHTFDVISTTEFLLIRLNYVYLNEYRWKDIDHLECLLGNASNLNGNILNLQSDRVLVKSITDSILNGINFPDIFNQELTSHLINSLLVVVARNLSKYQWDGVTESSDTRFIGVINYIQQNIYHPNLLKANVIAKEFHISPNYLSRFFKSQSNGTIQEYIGKYKIKLIENRLNYSDMRINEIVYEFGFTDGSHLNKFFKKHNKRSLSDYRKFNSSN